MDRAEFLKQLELHKLKLHLNHPARKLPTVAPVRGLRQPVGDDWSTTHPLVGNQILTHLTTTTEDARRRRASLSAAGSRGKSVTTPIHTVFIEAARGSGPSLECWGRTQDDLDLSVLFIGANVVTEGAFAHELPGRASKRGRGFANRLPTTEGRAPPLASDSFFLTRRSTALVLKRHRGRFRLPFSVARRVSTGTVFGLRQIKFLVASWVCTAED